ncbi:MAG: YjbQ family protein, partial [Saprospiraceae bacterium]
MVRHYSILVGPYSRGFHIITREITEAVAIWPENGMLHAFLHHTSAGLCINENADASVREDFKLYFEELAPEDLEGITHDMEGPDDMPA